MNSYLYSERDVFDPAIRLFGPVDEKMLDNFLQLRDKAFQSQDPISVELMTSGGIADIGRRICTEIELARIFKKRDMIFIGKTIVYSAGITIMAAFPRERRFLTSDTRLLIHSRKIDEEVRFEGPLKANEQIARVVLAEVECGLELEEEGFRKLVEGSRVTLDEVKKQAETNWYLTAQKALELGLVAGVI